jgi:hypothetical protein
MCRNRPNASAGFLRRGEPSINTNRTLDQHPSRFVLFCRALACSYSHRLTNGSISHDSRDQNAGDDARTNSARQSQAEGDGRSYLTRVKGTVDGQTPDYSYVVKADTVISGPVDVVAFARKLGVLKPFEEIAL